MPYYRYECRMLTPYTTHESLYRNQDLAIFTQVLKKKIQQANANVSFTITYNKPRPTRMQELAVKVANQSLLDYTNMLRAFSDPPRRPLKGGRQS